MKMIYHLEITQKKEKTNKAYTTSFTRLPFSEGDIMQAK